MSDRSIETPSRMLSSNQEYAEPCEGASCSALGAIDPWFRSRHLAHPIWVAVRDNMRQHQDV
jgi:hypothetical protein